MPEKSRVIVSVNELTDIVSSYSSGKIEDLLASLEPSIEEAQACECRCGCVGVNCDCRGSVGRVSLDDEAWRRLQEGKAELATRLRQQLNLK